MDVISSWEQNDGVQFLSSIGMVTGMTVVDFGARVGHYSIPAAITVGKNGCVYSLDKDQVPLHELQRKVTHLQLNNVKVVKTNGKLSLDFNDESADMVLLYDVLHYMEKDNRDTLYTHVYRILKKSGILSVYPKHVIGDTPLNQFAGLLPDDVKNEIVDSGFVFRDKYCDILCHDDSLNRGCVFNFCKL